jgi:hypothetical protein
MNQGADAQTVSRRRGVIAAGVVVVLVLGWFVHGALLGSLVRVVLPWLGVRAGWEVSIGEVEARLFAPLVLRDVRVRNAEGTNVRLARVESVADGTEGQGAGARRWIGLLNVEGVSGVVVIPERPAVEVPDIRPEASAVSSRLAWLPRVVSLRGEDLTWRGGGWDIAAKDFDLLLSEDRAGAVRVASVSVRRGGWSRTFDGLQAVTAWRDGTAYFEDMHLDGGVMLDSVSLDLDAAPAVTVEARAFGGYVYADLTSAGGNGVKAALTAVNISLAEAGAFAALSEDLEGGVSLAKLTFNGDPAQWLSAQISLRVEAGGFSWRRNAVQELRLGASLAGRRLRVNEFLLQQEANLVKLRGTASVPDEVADWREVPVELDLTAQVGKVQSLAGLFGSPWSELSGGLQIEGSLIGKASDGKGWLKVRGWDLRARGIRPASVQADFFMKGRDLEVTGLGAQSGPNFLRGQGRISLKQPTAYQGRFELRVSEVAAYLDPLGRRAPDWAREGGVLLFWDGDGTAGLHSGVVSLELVKFTGDLNPVPVNAKLSATYSPGNIYVNRALLDRGPLSLSSSFYFGEKGLSVQDTQLFSGRTRLLLGEMFLPLSLEALLARKPWPEVVLADGELYANLRSDDLDLASLVALFGQQTSLRGRVDLRLDARGSWSDPVADGFLTVEGLRAGFPSFSLPEGRLEGTLQVKERKAAVQAKLTPKGSKPLVLDAVLPLSPQAVAGGSGVFDRVAPWDIRVEVPNTRVGLFALKPFSHALPDGTVQASVRASQTMADPRFEGFVAWDEVRWQLTGGWTPWQNMKGRVAFSGTKATIEEARADVGSGRLQFDGGADFKDFGNPAWDLRIQGKELPLFESETFRLQASADLHARGEDTAGELTGSLDLTGSAVLKGVALDPGLQATTAGNLSPVPGVTAGSFDDWKINVKVAASTLIPVGGVAGSGELAPDLYLLGTLGSPLLLGSVHVTDFQIGLPSQAVLQAGGAIHFTREFPWRPVLDLAGTSRIGDHEVRAGAFGPLDEKRLFLSTDPPLTLAQLVILLDTGIAPTAETADQVAALTPGAGLSKAPWLDLEKIRGLLGWGEEVPQAKDGLGGELLRSGEAVSYDWSWR